MRITICNRLFAQTVWCYLPSLSSGECARSTTSFVFLDSYLYIKRRLSYVTTYNSPTYRSFMMDDEEMKKLFLFVLCLFFVAGSAQAGAGATPPSGSLW